MATDKTPADAVLNAHTACDKMDFRSSQRSTAQSSTAATRYPLAAQSWIRPLVFPPTTWSTRLGWLAVTAGTAVTLCKVSTDPRDTFRSGGPVLLCGAATSVSTPHSRIRPERHDLVSGRGDDIEAPLHVAHCEMGHVVHVERPLRAEDGEPPPRLTVVRDGPGRLEVGRCQRLIQEERLGVERPYCGEASALVLK